MIISSFLGLSVCAQLQIGGIDLNRVKEACPTYVKYQDSCIKMEIIYAREIDSLQSEIELQYTTFDDTRKNFCMNPEGRLKAQGGLQQSELEFQQKMEMTNLNLIALDNESEMKTRLVINQAIKNVALYEQLTMILDINRVGLEYFVCVDYTDQVIQEILIIDNEFQE